MPDYQKSKIYKIISNGTDDIYIGSTTETLSRRLAGHTRSYKTYLGGKGNNVSSFNILKYGDAKIILIEECPCDSKEQLLAREQYYIDNTDCVNKYRAINLLTKKEYHKELYQKALKNNPNLGKDNYKKALESNPNHNKDRYKKALESNPNYNKDKYQKDKQIQSQKILCECGLERAKYSLRKHKTSKIHNDLLSKKILTQ
jgi:hypothetical protein